MALKHFASQIQNKQAPQVSDPKVPTSSLPHAGNTTGKQAAPAQATPTEPGLKPVSRLAKLEAMKVNAVGKPSPQAAKAAPAGILTPQKAVSAQANAYSDDGANPTLQEIPLTWTDQQMLCALSAMQIRYGRPNEAIPYLMMIRKINPKNLECCRLLALAFMRLQRWHEADAMIAEYEYLQQSTQSSAMDGVIMLYRSLVAFKTNRITDAKNWFGKFRSLNKVT